MNLADLIIEALRNEPVDTFIVDGLPITIYVDPKGAKRAQPGNLRSIVLHSKWLAIMVYDFGSSEISISRHYAEVNMSFDWPSNKIKVEDPELIPKLIKLVEWLSLSLNDEELKKVKTRERVSKY